MLPLIRKKENKRLGIEAKLREVGAKNQFIEILPGIPHIVYRAGNGRLTNHIFVGIDNKNHLVSNHPHTSVEIGGHLIISHPIKKDYIELTPFPEGKSYLNGREIDETGTQITSPGRYYVRLGNAFVFELHVLKKR